jgi:methionine synthase II (cobalamin-independent)
MTTISRAEVIGSLLRPPSLQEARRAWEAGQLPTPEFKRIEDRAVDELYRQTVGYRPELTLVWDTWWDT